MNIFNASNLAPYFQPGTQGGQMRLDGQRMILFYASAFTEFRRGLIDLCGSKATRSLIMRVAYAEGVKGADLLCKLHKADESDIYNYRLSALIHELAGYALLDFKQMKIDIQRGIFEVDLALKDSVEAESHLAAYGSSSESVCWLLMGYLSGYSSAFMGRMVVFRELQCSASGHATCRMVGRLADQWNEAERQHAMATGPLISQLSLGQAEEPLAAGANEIVGVSSAFHSVLYLVDKVASTRSTVLLYGETGVGKEVIGRLVHRRSDRSEKPFVAVNCAAIPASLIESELFGVERGAYSGATHSRPGRFERAEGGTLFLDEIGTLDFASQGKLLRALQEGELERIGDQRTRKVNVRVIAATNADLRNEVREGRFREDLFFRLTTFPIRVPPLRERRADVPLLVDFFFKRFCKTHDKKPSGFTQDAVAILMAHPYPGNVRQLEHMVERAVILADQDRPIDSFHLYAFEDERQAKPVVNSVSDVTNLDSILRGAREKGLGLQALENEALRIAVSDAQGNISQAARSLGLTRRQLAYKLQQASLADGA
ncbi:MAG: sigma 54-interacting transcriptional regulator [Rugosibacter sp.]|jgi:DNA-binding NtrC family response regulator/predicted hydrocarbon binding protein|nr:sigma 54-interacting transcriptional regulator [Rugosibacter sp.]MDO9272650.1 sigma 54-interacting transcriptional regulator [Rugosibacter sp.]